MIRDGVTNHEHHSKRIRVGDVITCVNDIGTEESTRMRAELHTAKKLRCRVRCGRCAGAELLIDHGTVPNPFGRAKITEKVFNTDRPFVADVTFYDCKRGKLTELPEKVDMQRINQGKYRTVWIGVCPRTDYELGIFKFNRDSTKNAG